MRPSWPPRKKTHAVASPWWYIKRGLFGWPRSPNPYVHKKEYNLGTIDGIIDGFLTEYDSQTKDIRFNLFIDSKINGYLQRTSQNSGRTKAEIMRELVLKEMRYEERKN